MKDYKRLTDSAIASMISRTLDNRLEAKTYIRLAELEDKIESSELCEREEVRKETAQEILQKLYRRTRNYHGNRCVLTSKDVIDIAELYGIDLEDEE